MHGLVPRTYVDHTHADAVVTVSNLPDGQERLRDIYGDRVLVLPYVMPGFVLAKQFASILDQLDDYDGVVSSHHGLFTFADDARDSYEMTIQLVDMAEQHLADNFGKSILQPVAPSDPLRVDMLESACVMPQAEPRSRFPQRALRRVRWLTSPAWSAVVSSPPST